LLFVFAFDAADTLFWRLRPGPLATVLEIRNLPTADCGSSRIAELFGAAKSCSDFSLCCVGAGQDFTAPIFGIHLSIVRNSGGREFNSKELVDTGIKTLPATLINFGASPSRAPYYELRLDMTNCFSRLRFG
jgi:hypothetical protein